MFCQSLLITASTMPPKTQRVNYLITCILCGFLLLFVIYIVLLFYEVEITFVIHTKQSETIQEPVNNNKKNYNSTVNHHDTTHQQLQDKPPNFILILTDDQDAVTNSMEYMPFTDNYFKQNGITFTNAYIPTPLCCPSRIEQITGRLYHNIRQKKPGDCLGVSGKLNIFNNKHSMFQKFHKNDYLTASFGKLAFNDPNHWCNKDKPLTDGFSRIQSPCGRGPFQYYATKYMNYYKNGNTKITEYTIDESLYYTSMIGNASIKWINNTLSNHKDKSFLAWIGVRAPHFPATPSNWYSNLFLNMTVPKSETFNLHVDNHNDFVSFNPKIEPLAIKHMDQLYRNRVRTLLSVDDLFKSLIDMLIQRDALKNTYIIFSSDHGYHMGQFRVPCGKQLIYETDIRIPLFMSGPDIKKGIENDKLVSNIDFLPTLLDLAGIKYNDNVYDGISWIKGLDILTKDKNKDRNNEWRDRLLIEYKGRREMPFAHCLIWWPSGKEGDVGGNIVEPPGGNKNGTEYRINSDKNQWRGLRIMNNTMNSVYAEFYHDFDNKTEINDPNQINNIYNDLDAQTQNEFHQLLSKYAQCKGNNCK